MAALDELVGRPGHIVAQVVEAEFVVRAVGDVRGVLLAAQVRGHVRLDTAGLHAEETEDAAHQFGLVGGQVVVDRDDVDRIAGESVEVGRGRGDQGLAFTGLHLGDVAQVQGGAAHELDIEVTQAQGPARCFAHGGEGFGKQGVEGLAVFVALLEPAGFLTQFGVCHLAELIGQLVDGIRVSAELLQSSAFTCAQKLLEEISHFSPNRHVCRTTTRTTV